KDFDEDAAIELTRLEAACTARTIYVYLTCFNQEFTIEEITKDRSKNKDYKDLVDSLKGLSYNPEPPPSSSESEGEKDGL
ncbi:hypothetical protein Trydic_g5313, partial [Trypoxylus dichotomus]